MEQILDLIGNYVSEAFEMAGYDRELGRVTVSNRPDLCEYQCNGAMAGAKRYHKAPLQIAQEVAEHLEGCDAFDSVEAVKPGFLNLTLSGELLSGFLNEMKDDTRLGVPEAEVRKKIIIDYGGANVAKPLHVGHLRSAVIGESIKRILRYMGHETIGDVHLGDWGLQMGLIIAQLRSQKPDLVYFDESYDGEYPEEAPFTISELEQIYPEASRRSKEDEAFRAEALKATEQLQHGNAGLAAQGSGGQVRRTGAAAQIRTGGLRRGAGAHGLAEPAVRRHHRLVGAVRRGKHRDKEDDRKLSHKKNRRVPGLPGAHRLGH